MDNGLWDSLHYNIITGRQKVLNMLLSVARQSLREKEEGISSKQFSHGDNTHTHIRNEERNAF